MTSKRNKPLVTITLDPSLIAKLVEMAARTGHSKSTIIADLLREAPMPKTPKPFK